MSIKAPPPADEQPNPYLPAGPKPPVFEDFQGINTQTTRAGVSDKQMAWCDGFFPIEPRNLRTLYGIGSALYTAPSLLTIVAYFFYNIGPIAYCAVLQSDGSVINVNVATKAFSTLLLAGTISSPLITNVGFCQYGQQYLIIVVNQTNGYFVWDGMLLYQAGTLGPVATLTNTGSSYKTVPVVQATGGSGSGATFVATIANGEVINVVVTNPGSGYLPGQIVTLKFQGGNSGGSGGSLTANLASTGSGSGATFANPLYVPLGGPAVGFTQLPSGYWTISSVNITNGGSGYSQFTILQVTQTNGNVIQPAVLEPVISGGVIVGVTIVNGGTYVALVNQHPFPLAVSISAADAGAFVVASVTINNGGSGYSPSAIAVCTGGGAPVSQATLQLVLTGGVITGVTIASPGLYGSNTAPTVTVSDAVVNATGTVELMPFGVQGTAVETYAGHAWVVDGPNVVATAPGSVTDFAVSDGGVDFTSNNSNLKVGYTRLLSTNGLLYLIGDSAVDYISGVTTTGTGPVTTTYTYQNVDPEVGSPYPASILTFGNAFLYANSVGVHLCAGGTVTKVSDDLDGSGIPNGLWNSVANFGGNQISSAKANIFGKRVWMALATVLDPISGSQVNKLFMWNGQYWWASAQDVGLTYIAASELNSVLTAYGTDGTHIYPLFQQPSTAFTKTVQSRLWDAPGGYMHVKSATRLFGISQYYSASNPTITVSVDNENGSMASPYSITPSGIGYFVWPPEAVGQTGVLTGLTIKTGAADMSLVSVALADEIVQYRG
jgi:hypothetical protein